MNRHSQFSRLFDQETPFDIAIVGGGARGLGAAVDAASRGHSVVLIEQCDFAKGSSSRSSQIAHGGLRDLQHGNFALLLESLRERKLLFLNAPHLLKRVPFIIPNFRWWEWPLYGFGLSLYDSLAGNLGMQKSRHLTSKEVLEKMPCIAKEHLYGGVMYYEGVFDDARLALNLARTATLYGAVVLNHVKCVGLSKTGGEISGLVARDESTGKEFKISARSVVNATGVFVDALRRHDSERVLPLLGNRLGVHLVLPGRFLASDSALLVPNVHSGNTFFAVPWHGRVLVGCTDSAVEEASLEPRALAEDVALIFSQIGQYLTTMPKVGDVLSVFAGLRPVVQSSKGRVHPFSRDHLIEVSDSGLISVTGGNWTTYRKTAEDVIDYAELVGGLDRCACCTETLSIHGSTTEVAPEPNLRVYGSDAQKIREIMLQEASLAETIHPRLEFQKAEVIWHCRNEMACTVEDVLARRVRALILDARASIEAAPVVARQMAEELGHDEKWIAEQVSSFKSLADGYVLG